MYRYCTLAFNLTLHSQASASLTYALSNIRLTQASPFPAREDHPTPTCRCDDQVSWGNSPKDNATVVGSWHTQHWTGLVAEALTPTVLDTLTALSEPRLGATANNNDQHILDTSSFSNQSNLVKLWAMCLSVDQPSNSFLFFFFWIPFVDRWGMLENYGCRLQSLLPKWKLLCYLPDYLCMTDIPRTTSISSLESNRATFPTISHDSNFTNGET